MNDSELRCSYHPNREPITKCEFCGRLICVECKMVYQQRHSRSRYGSGIGTHSNHYRTYYYSRHELCTPCYYDRRIKVIKSPANYILIIMGSGAAVFGLIFLIVTLNMINSFSIFPSFFPVPTFLPIIPLIPMIIGIGLVIIGIIVISTAPKRAATMEAKKKEFFSNLTKLSKTKKSQDTKPSEFRYCPNCGDKNDPGQKYCEKCGKDLTPS